MFGAENFVNEIVWKRSDSKNDAGQGAKHFGRVNDVILFYQKTDERLWFPQYGPLDEEYVRKFYRHVDPDGRRWKLDNMLGPGGAAKGNPQYEVMGVTRYWRYSRARMDELIAAGRVIQTNPGTVPMYKRYLDESKGTSLSTNWSDISMIRGWSMEKLGYPTQKPRALLERIISASSNPGDVVLDPFCGCGTAVDAAQKLGRHWIGIDITHLAIGLIEKRLREGYGNDARFETIGSPRDLASAQRLATDDPHQFQQWITLRLGGWPWMGGKKGGDRGVDGYFYYVGEGGQTETGVISVKAGNNVNPAMVRDLGRVMQRDGHKIGLFVCAAPPTRGMEQEADSHGLVQTEFGRFPALQIFTLSELFADRHPRLPPLVSPNRRARRVETRVSHLIGAQGGLDL